jgi:hypothetical protein
MEQPTPMTAEDIGKPEAAPEHLALIERWLSTIREDKKFHDDAFKRMREDQRFAANTNGAQWEGDEEKYVANITLRHVRNKVSALYAKNPRVKAQRAERMEYRIWDGKIEKLNAALETKASAHAAQQAMMTGVPPAPTVDNATGAVIPPPPPPDPVQVMLADELIQDAVQGYQRKQQYDKIGRTLEILYHHQMREQNPTFKVEAKQCVRRTVTCGVGYVRTAFQRDLARDPSTIKQLADSTGRLAKIEALIANCQSPEESEQYQAEKAELANAVAALEARPEIAVREGIQWSWPTSTQVIPDRRCRQLVGFIGANHLTIEHMMTVGEVQEVFQVKLDRTDYQGYQRLTAGKGIDSSYARRSDGDTHEGDLVCIYEVQDKKTGTVFFLCDGHKDYIRQPAPPKVDVEGFWDIDVLVFNTCENEYDLYPPSDVRLLMHQQKELNRSREALREHRIAATPRWGAIIPIADEVRAAIKGAAPFTTIELGKGLPPGAKIADVFGPIPMPPIDPAMYDANPIHDDVSRVGGSSDANFQVTSGGTATESTIAEGARVSSVDDNKDDLDEWLTAVARKGGQILFKEVSKRTVLKIVGPGAMWPEFSTDEIREELYLEIIAGSSGRPNKAMDVANFERMAPTLIQLPGLNPATLARHSVRVLDDRLDPDEWLMESNPSITALNALAGKPAATQPGTGDPATDPGAQGQAGAQQAPANPIGAQPPPEGMFPAGGGTGPY